MKKAKCDLDDPVVTEVRAWRAQLVKEAGGTIHGLLQLLREEKTRSKRPVPAKKGSRKPPSRKRRNGGRRNGRKR